MNDNKYEPFDIERALKGEPLIRRDGKLINEYEIFYSKLLEKISFFPLTIIYLSDNGNLIELKCTENGCYDIRDKDKGFYSSNEQLFMAPKNTKKYYIAIGRSKMGRSKMGRTLYKSIIHESPELAKEEINNFKESITCFDAAIDYIKTLEFEIEE